MNQRIIQQFTAMPLALGESHLHGLVASIRAMVASEPKTDLSALSYDWLGNEIPATSMSDGVMTIPLHGVVAKGLGPLGKFFGFLDVGEFTAQVESAAQDPDVGMIALSIASPGGTVLGTRTAAEAVANAAQSKPVLAYTDDMMTSAAYYIGVGANQVMVGSGAAVGSVGVFTYLLDSTQFFEDRGVKAFIIRSGDKKAIGAYDIDKLDEEKLAIVQEEVDAFGAEFRGFVQSHRAISDDNLQGQYFSGEESTRRNFADRTARTLSEALRSFAL